MRVVLTNPFCWPYVHRGSERFISEFALYLISRGHEVVTISSRPGRGTVEKTDMGTRVIHGQPWLPFMARLRVRPEHLFFFGSLGTLLRTDADVVHSLFYTDSWAANLARRRRGYRTVFQIVGPPVPWFFPRVPPYRWILKRAIMESDRSFVHSEFTREIVRSCYGADLPVLPVPIDLERFPLGRGPEDGRPVLLSVAAFDEPRKGLRVLLKAFALVREDIPDAVLRLSGKMPEDIAKRLEELPASVRSGIEILTADKAVDVGALYRGATLTILPSMWEAYGMVVVESFASGTPVVVTNHGGLGELVSDPSLGLTFDPMTDGMETVNHEGLADAMLKGLKLAGLQETRLRCRARAERYAWPVLGPEYERLYSSMSQQCGLT